MPHSLLLPHAQWQSLSILVASEQIHQVRTSIASILTKQAPVGSGQLLQSYREFSKCPACEPDLSDAPETIKACGDRAYLLSGQERPPSPPYGLAAETEPPTPLVPRPELGRLHWKYFGI